MRPVSRPIPAETASPSDAELVARLGSNDLMALGELYDRYQGDVTAVIARSGVAHADVEDVVQESFLQLIKCARQYDGRPNARAWIVGIAWRVGAHRRRSVRRWIRALVGLQVSPAPERAPDPEDVLISKQAHVEFERALAALPVRMRDAIVLVEMEGLSGEEAARALGIPTATVWSRLHYGRKRLGALLDDGDEK